MYRIHRAVHWASIDAYIRSLGPAAWFRQGVGITVTGSGVSQWDDQSGNGRHLLQGTDAARPIDLPFSGTRYLYLPGVAGNYASTPDSAANSITGDIDIRVRAAAGDWTPSALMYFCGKYNSSAGEHAWVFRVEATTGLFRFIHSQDGSADIAALSTSAPSFADGSAYWARVTRGSASGDVNFYTAPDADAEPSSWTKLGNTVSTTAGSIRDNSASLNVGAIENTGTGGPFAGKIYRVIIKNGIDGTTVVDFNPADADGDGDTSFASSTTGETWTINSSGGLPAQIVGRAAVLFNGTSHYLKTNAFTLNQPTCVLWVGKQVSWTLNDWLFDGNATNSGAAYQSATTPRIVLRTGATVTPENANLAVNTLGVLSAVFNSTSSSSRVNNTTAVTGNAGSGNMGGLTLGAAGGGTNFANISTSELIVFPFAPSTELQARIIAGLMARHGVA